MQWRIIGTIALSISFCVPSSVSVKGLANSNQLQKHRPSCDLCRCEQLDDAGVTAIIRPSPLITKKSENRKEFLLRSRASVIITAAALVAPSATYAEEKTLSSDIERNAANKNRGGRPFAPVEALLPVTRLKIWLDSVHILSSNLSKAKNKNEEYKIIQEMDSIFSSPPKFFVSEQIKKRASVSMAQLTTSVSAANKDQYQFNRKGLNVGDKFAAMLNQADVERQWGMLQYAESKREESNEMRAIFNFYTRQLSFGDNYVLNAPKEERKKMIRNDELPSLTAVITADLDRRDLYRNQFLTAIEDARAEVSYQAKQKTEDVDVLDTIDLVNNAYVACESWFLLIAPSDIEEAINVITNSMESD